MSKKPLLSKRDIVALVRRTYRLDRSFHDLGKEVGRAANSFRDMRQAFHESGEDIVSGVDEGLIHEQ